MMYGLTEKQFRNLFERAKRKMGVTGEVFLTMLETRLDNVVYRLGLAKTRQAARQFVNHGHILVNGTKTDIPSFQVSVGDEIGVRENLFQTISNPKPRRIAIPSLSTLVGN